MFNGPIDLTPFGALLKALPILYLLLVILVTGVVVWFSKKWLVRIFFAALIPAVMLLPAKKLAEEKHAKNKAASELQLAARAEVEKAFELKCGSAKRTISRVVQGVDGLVWPTWRPRENDRDDQFLSSDPYGNDCTGIECIKSLLKVSKGQEINPLITRQHASGYEFIESTDENGKQLYRYVGVVKKVGEIDSNEIERLRGMGAKNINTEKFAFVLEKTSIENYTARYSLNWEDVSSREDRDYWIAGGALKVVDRTTAEVIAERIGFIRDPGMGSTHGFRQPWGWAQSYGPRCPSDNREKTLSFANSVLVPK